MTIQQASPEQDRILDFIDESVRHLQDGGLEPRFILVGRQAYEKLRHAIASRFGRDAGFFEQYQYLTIVVDPFREGEVAVLPRCKEVAEGVESQSI